MPFWRNDQRSCSNWLFPKGMVIRSHTNNDAMTNATGPLWGNSSGLPHKFPAMQSFDVSYVVSLKNLLSKQVAVDFRYHNTQCISDPNGFWRNDRVMICYHWVATGQDVLSRVCLGSLGTHGDLSDLWLHAIFRLGDEAIRRYNCICAEWDGRG